MNIHTALTIAGTDPTGGAGIQADLKTMTAHGVYGMSVVTALVAQNTMGVIDILEVPPKFLAAQLDAVFLDIPPDAVATSGDRLISADAVEALCKELLPRAAIITPNIPEAEIMIGREITDAAGMEQAAVMIYERFRAAVLMKGGHHVDDANDLLVDDKGARWFRGRRIATENTHGTGCTLSSAIASNLAQGMDLDTAVARAKEYLSGALAAGLNLGKGHGPMAHTFDLRSTFIHQQRAHL